MSESPFFSDVNEKLKTMSLKKKTKHRSNSRSIKKTSTCNHKITLSQNVENNFEFKPDSHISNIEKAETEDSRKKECMALYKNMWEYATMKIGTSSKFPAWFKNIPSPKDYSWDEFLDRLIKQGIPSRKSEWNNSHLNKLKEILKSVKEIRPYDFDSDKLNMKGKQYQKKSLDKWKMLENSEFYRNILNINSLINEDFDAATLPQEWQKNGNIDETQFRGAALIILPGLASYVQEEIKRIEKEKNKTKGETGIDVSNPEKFSKSKKMRLVSLLITYLLKDRKCDPNIARLHSAGRHAIFVESKKRGEPVHIKFTDLGGNDYIDISKLKRDESALNDPEIRKNMDIGQKLSRIKNMAMYQSADKSSEENARAAMAEVEFKDQTKIDSAYKLLLVAWDVCVFFHYLHSNEVRMVHCDIKRANICVTKDATYVIDIDGMQPEGYSRHPAGTLKNSKLNYVKAAFSYLKIGKNHGKVWLDQTDDLNSFGRMMKEMINSYKSEYNEVREEKTILDGLSALAVKCEKFSHTEEYAEDDDSRPVYADELLEDIKKIAESLNEKQKTEFDKRNKESYKIQKDLVTSQVKALENYSWNKKDVGTEYLKTNIDHLSSLLNLIRLRKVTFKQGCDGPSVTKKLKKFLTKLKKQRTDSTIKENAVNENSINTLADEIKTYVGKTIDIQTTIKNNK